jgi:hypothetical protein
MARRVKQKQLKPIRPVLLCEGQTELFYFKHLATLNGADRRFQFDVRKTWLPMKITDIERVIKEDASDGDFVCVFDLDITLNDKSQRDAFIRLEKEYAHSCKVLLCYSMPSIEYWFLLHYENTNAQLSSKQVLERLTKHLPFFNKEKQFLEREQWVAELEKRRKAAEERAHLFAKNKTETETETELSYTELYRVFRDLKSANEM